MLARPDMSPEAMPLALCICGTTDLALWGSNLAERLKRQFAQAGITDVLSEADAPRREGPVIVVRADSVIDAPLIAVLRERPGLMLMSEGFGASQPLAIHAAPGTAAAAIASLSGSPGGPFTASTPSALKADFWKSLRKRETPYAVRADRQRIDDIAWRMFMGTYKGATDVVTKHLWPVPAYYTTRFLAPLGVTPNMVTLVATALVFVVFWLFLEGHYGWGLAGAWLMTFLDTVDGKLARTTLTSSKWGDILDHGIDLIHPPFWYAAWALGLATIGIVWSDTTFWVVMIAILGGYILQRIMEGIAIKWLGLEIHIWRPIDTLFRQITARRNSNLVILTVSVLFGRPDLGLIAVAIWTVLCLLLHGIQLAHAFAVRRRTGRLDSWMTRSAP
ncbi:MAG: CDP-alcohol phosphatidyltransferase family protein [Rhizobiales bacterium]|nr:CDP-alcohol phosphatidyltransferase family protein [Hyphomicrobiales bacterium]